MFEVEITSQFEVESLNLTKDIFIYFMNFLPCRLVTIFTNKKIKQQ